MEFNPTRDIPDLGGKVFLVTGGKLGFSFSLHPVCNLSATFSGSD